MHLPPSVCYRLCQGLETQNESGQRSSRCMLCRDRDRHKDINSSLFADVFCDGRDSRDKQKSATSLNECGQSSEDADRGCLLVCVRKLWHGRGTAWQRQKQQEMVWNTESFTGHTKKFVLDLKGDELSCQIDYVGVTLEGERWSGDYCTNAVKRWGGGGGPGGRRTIHKVFT